MAQSVGVAAVAEMAEAEAVVASAVEPGPESEIAAAAVGWWIEAWPNG